MFSTILTQDSYQMDFKHIHISKPRDIRRKKKCQYRKHLITNWAWCSFVSDLHENTSISVSSLQTKSWVQLKFGQYGFWVDYGKEMNMTGLYSLPDTSFIALVILLNVGFKDLKPTSANTKDHTEISSQKYTLPNTLHISDLTLSLLTDLYYILFLKIVWIWFTDVPCRKWKI